MRAGDLRGHTSRMIASKQDNVRARARAALGADQRAGRRGTRSPRSPAAGAPEADVKLAVSEAVGERRHPRLSRSRPRDDPGPGADRARQALVISVADDGDGMRPNLDSPGLGLGISLITKVAKDVRFDSSDGERRSLMSFAAAPEAAHDERRPGRLELRTESSTARRRSDRRRRGEVDLASAARAGRDAARGGDAGGVALVLDLAGVPFMDSSGLRELLVVSERARRPARGRRRAGLRRPSPARHRRGRRADQRPAERGGGARRDREGRPAVAAEARSDPPTRPAPVDHYAAIFEFSDDAILTKDLDAIITSWNPGAERIYGYTAEEASGSRSRS